MEQVITRDERINKIINLLSNKINLKKTTGIDYRLLGKVWEKKVIAHLKTNGKNLKLEINKLKEFKFNHKFNIIKTDNPILDKIKKSYFVFDGALLSETNMPEVILEIKLGLQNFGLKELEYLYLIPSCKMICLTFYPSIIDREEEFKEYIQNSLLVEFNDKYNIEPPFELDLNRISFIGKASIGISNKIIGKLLQYEENVIYYSRLVLKMLFDIYPKMLVKKDIISSLKIHHKVPSTILLHFQEQNLLDTIICDIENNLGRIQKSVVLFSLKGEIANNKIIKNHLEVIKYPKSFPNNAIISRKCFIGELRFNDQIILSYLSSITSWVTTQCIFENTNIVSTSEINRCLVRLHKLGKIEHKRGYLLDPTSISNKTYETSFYISKTFNNKDYVPPRRLFSPLELTIHELKVVAFLTHHEFTSIDKLITIKDLAGNLGIGHSTVNIMVKKLAKRNLKGIDETHPPVLKLESRWVEGITGKITKMRESPVIYLSINENLIDEIKEIMDHIGFDIPDCRISMNILDFPLAKNERLVIDAIRNGYNTIDTIAERIKINEIKKSNRAMIKVIVDRLADQNTWWRRLGKKKTLINIQGDKLQFNWFVKLDSEKIFDNS